MGYTPSYVCSKKASRAPPFLEGRGMLCSKAWPAYCSMYCFKSCRWLTLSFCRTSEM